MLPFEDSLPLWDGWFFGLGQSLQKFVDFDGETYRFHSIHFKGIWCTNFGNYHGFHFKPWFWTKFNQLKKWWFNFLLSCKWIVEYFESASRNDRNCHDSEAGFHETGSGCYATSGSCYAASGRCPACWTDDSGQGFRGGGAWILAINGERGPGGTCFGMWHSILSRGILFNEMIRHECFFFSFLLCTLIFRFMSHDLNFDAVKCEFQCICSIYSRWNRYRHLESPPGFWKDHLEVFETTTS